MRYRDEMRRYSVRRPPGQRSGTREKYIFPGSDEERKRKMSGKNSPKAT